MAKAVKMVLHYSAEMIDEAVKQHIQRNLGYSGDMEIVYTHKRKLKSAEANIKIFHGADTSNENHQIETSVLMPKMETETVKPEKSPKVPKEKVKSVALAQEASDDLIDFGDSSKAMCKTEDDFGSVEELVGSTAKTTEFEEELVAVAESKIEAQVTDLEDPFGDNAEAAATDIAEAAQIEDVDSIFGSDDDAAFAEIAEDLAEDNSPFDDLPVHEQEEAKDADITFGSDSLDDDDSLFN